eukprot:gnl/TRDRNA2_/TRDRNA2_141653_c2_seq4.p1 gnl/TRDRNA2_/TRDRNA2_141653_c2~~gnl/TRDRNA2_/TRDRNA2_141653_c2_seq4.p1  ORF type:complete len:156 (+),score=26.10 gnl/TRDRNA2_/TRDRNA2_141653_c2_seq4:165-632(+)
MPSSETVVVGGMSWQLFYRLLSRPAEQRRQDVTWIPVGDEILLLALRPLTKGAEAFNCYGELPQSRLLYDYGFVDGGENPYDSLTVDTEELQKACMIEFGKKEVKSRLRMLRKEGLVLPEIGQFSRLEQGLDADVEDNCAGLPMQVQSRQCMCKR